MAVIYSIFLLRGEIKTNLTTLRFESQNSDTKNKSSKHASEFWEYFFIPKIKTLKFSLKYKNII